jgi:hypothetical protein
MAVHRVIPNLNLRRMIRSGEITLGGNAKLKIYGTLACGSGKQMKQKNRIFFKNEQEAMAHGYRPCGALFEKKVFTMACRSSRLTTQSGLTTKTRSSRQMTKN